jgi:hypothetical protein
VLAGYASSHPCI